MRPAAWKGLPGRVERPRNRFDFDRKPIGEPRQLAGPERVIASAYRDSNATTFVLKIPSEIAEHPEGRRGLNYRLMATAHAMANQMTAELQAGRSIEWATGYRWFTGAWVAAELAKGRIKVDPRTAYSYVQEVVSWGSLRKITQAHGQLRKVTRRGATDWCWTRGANVYALAEIACNVVVEKFTRSLISPITYTPNSFSVSGCNTETRRRRRADGALAWAVRTAYPGCRNLIGYRLAATLKKAEIEDWVARDILLEYRDQVGDRSYTRADALASLRSAYRDSRVYVEAGVSAARSRSSRYSRVTYPPGPGGAGNGGS